jgi:hypothetical protein
MTPYFLETADLIPDYTALRPYSGKPQIFHIKIGKRDALKPQQILLVLSTHSACFGSTDYPETLNK